MPLTIDIPESDSVSTFRKVERRLPSMCALLLFFSLLLQKSFTIDASTANSLHKSHIGLSAYLCYYVILRLEFPSDSASEAPGKKVN
ncbi:hypothetical protein EAE99_010475 [Botrytis elliptica]|nr:hypothetical protein EAE99_010475 [Botrytis elliptica]